MIHTLMKDEIFTKITGKPLIDTKDIKHSTINFVDDSTNLIMTKDPEMLRTYLNNFYILLQKVYHTNKLIINQEKTEIMIVCKNKHRKQTKTYKGMLASKK